VSGAAGEVFGVLLEAGLRKVKAQQFSWSIGERFRGEG
jgi:hypothetical protein